MHCQASFRIPAGVRLVGENPLVDDGVCVSSLFRCLAKGRGWYESVAVATWKHWVTS